MSDKSAKGSASTGLANRATNNGEVAVSRPAFMADAPSGKNNIDASDMIIPRLALMQSTHEQVEEQLAKSGDFWHTILEQVLGESFDDLVVVHHSKRWNLWKPRHEGGGILARATNGTHWDEQFRGMTFEVAPYKDQPRKKVKWTISEDGRVGRDIGLGAWGSSDPENADSQPAATLSHVLVCTFLSKLDIGPFVILLQRTSEKVGKALLTKINIDNAPIYGQVYALSSKSDSGPSGDYKQYVFTKNGYVPDEETFNVLRKMNEDFERLEAVKFNDDDAADEGAGGAGGAGGDGGASDSNAKY